MNGKKLSTEDANKWQNMQQKLPEKDLRKSLAIKSIPEV